MRPVLRYQLLTPTAAAESTTGGAAQSAASSARPATRSSTGARSAAAPIVEEESEDENVVEEPRQKRRRTADLKKLLSVFASSAYTSVLDAGSYPQARTSSLLVQLCGQLQGKTSLSSRPSQPSLSSPVRDTRLPTPRLTPAPSTASDELREYARRAAVCLGSTYEANWHYVVALLSLVDQAQAQTSPRRTRAAADGDLPASLMVRVRRVALSHALSSTRCARSSQLRTLSAPTSMPS